MAACSVCTAPVPRGDAFCSQCGAPVVDRKRLPATPQSALKNRAMGSDRKRGVGRPPALRPPAGVPDGSALAAPRDLRGLFDEVVPAVPPPAVQPPMVALSETVPPTPRDLRGLFDEVAPAALPATPREGVGVGTAALLQGAVRDETAMPAPRALEAPFDFAAQGVRPAAFQEGGGVAPNVAPQLAAPDEAAAQGLLEEVALG
eukprot:896953-Lingulodinium_polyedra.AAC.1